MRGLVTAFPLVRLGLPLSAIGRQLELATQSDRGFPTGALPPTLHNRQLFSISQRFSTFVVHRSSSFTPGSSERLPARLPRETPPFHARSRSLRRSCASQPW